MSATQTIGTGQLLTEYRELMLRLGADRNNTALARQADQYEAEIARRMAW